MSRWNKCSTFGSYNFVSINNKDPTMIKTKKQSGKQHAYRHFLPNFGPHWQSRRTYKVNFCNEPVKVRKHCSPLINRLILGSKCNFKKLLTPMCFCIRFEWQERPWYLCNWEEISVTILLFSWFIFSIRTTYVLQQSSL